MTKERILLGGQGEEVSISFLKDEGYKIIETNYRNRIGEIDIIAQEGSLLCFVEVRSKCSFQTGHPFESITYKKKLWSVPCFLNYGKQWPGLNYSYPA